MRVALNIMRGALCSALNIIRSASSIMCSALNIISGVLNSVRGALNIICGALNIIRGAFKFQHYMEQGKSKILPKPLTFNIF